MILPDINLLLYAYNEALPQHAAARAWWKNLMTNERAVAIPWAVSFGFIRLATHPALFRDPLPPLEALERVQGWLTRPHVHILEPGGRHLSIVESLFSATGVAGSLTTDTHLAALAIEHQCELHSNDGDFGRFPGLRWRNPIE
ncbi:MAG TPA: type II toxin-antitoxin system VapC family toxin [Candidatus Acidoferrales bacterium]|nr:type II toxin-antitoxin system VapC family toxin [Candidatus Acidoferrales bacterium]